MFHSANAKNDKDLEASDYVLVVFVIGIVAISSLYFCVVLTVEMYRSFRYYKTVVKERKREKKAAKARLVQQHANPMNQEAKITEMVEIGSGNRNLLRRDADGGESKTRVANDTAAEISQRAVSVDLDNFQLSVNPLVGRVSTRRLQRAATSQQQGIPVVP